MGTVISQLSECHEIQVQENREYFSQLIDVLLYSSGQAIFLRVHFEGDNSLNQGKIIKK